MNETKKVSDRIASGILFAFPSFSCFYFAAWWITRLQRFSIFLLSHPHRASFFFALNSRGWDFFPSCVCYNQFVLQFHLVFFLFVLVTGIMLFDHQQGEKKREFFFVFNRAIEKCRSWTKVDLPVRGKGPFPLSDLSHWKRLVTH